ncbi:MAG: pilus (MSHA type) biogenesis protein MshL [Campylobacteraceae bacterium]|jgi:general secretion pathway protein D|nr:pilus (MSHA type) biogenesis protein MshL [Campylobacteraceae bacterium]
MKIASLQQIKKSFAFAACVALLALLPQYSFAAPQSNKTLQTKKGCEYKNLNIKINANVQLVEVLSQLSELCDFSVVFADAPAIEIANQPLYGTNIKDKSLFETLDILLASNNLNYEYKNSVLKLSALETKSFKVDYITSIRQGTATMSASVSATPQEAGGTSEAPDKADNSITVKEEFDFWKTIDAEVQAVVNTGREIYVAKPPIINPKAGLVTITATKEQLQRAQDYFDALKNRLLKQVLIDVTILSVDLNDDNRMGIDWSKFQLGFIADAASDIIGINTGSSWSNNNWKMQNGPNAAAAGERIARFGSSGHIDSNDIGKFVAFNAGVSFSLDGVFDFLKEKGKTNVVSNPKVLTLNNQQALITVGDTINYQTTETTSNAGSGNGNVISEDVTNYSVFIGILLNLLPTISDDNNIMLRINPSISDFKYVEDNQKQTTPRRIAPDTTEKKLSTVVNVKNGDTIVLGGLITNSVVHTNKGVPVLGSIPLLGYAFKYAGEETKTKELVFIITPKIIGEEDTSAISAKSLDDLGYKSLGR